MAKSNRALPRYVCCQPTRTCKFKHPNHFCRVVSCRYNIEVAKITGYGMELLYLRLGTN